MIALAPVRNEDAPPIISIATAGVAAMVRLDGFDRSRRLVWYLLRLAGAHRTVHGAVVGVLHDGRQIELGRLEVPPGAVSESRFAIRQSRRDRFAHLYLDLRSDDLVLRVETPRAPLPPAARGLRLGLALMGAGILIAGGGLFALALPRPPLLVGPPTIAAGDTAHIAYETRGAGTVRYRATADDGHLLATGTLDAPKGDIAVAIPQGLERRRVVVRLDLGGPLGTAAGETSLAVVPPASVAASVPPARIAAFSARRDGDGVLASYLAVGESGRVAVVDGNGRVIGAAPFSRGGTTRVSIPPARASETLNARLDVRRGDSHATATIELRVPAATVPATEPAVGVKGVDSNASDSPNESSTDDPFSVLGTPIEGQPMTILIRRRLPGMRLRLADDVGTSLGEVIVPANAARVMLALPRATAAHNYYLTCTYGSGNAEEVVVRSVRVSAP